MRPDIGQDQARNRPVLIELAEEGGEDFRVGIGLVDPRETGAAAPVLAPAIEEDLDTGLAALGEQGEDIGLGDALGTDGILHRNGRKGADAVADAGGLFIVHGLSRGAHLVGQAGDHGARPALQKGRGLVDQAGIVLERDQAGAGGRAAFDLVQHAGPGAALIDAVGTRPQQEGLLQGVERPVHRPGRGEGAEIVAGRGVGPAMLADLGRAVVLADHQFGERLVVAQHDVEARLQLFDEAGFEQQGLGLGGGDDQLHRPGQGDHQADALGVEAALGVLQDALFDRLRLADIEAGPVLAIHAIDARLVRGAARLVADQVGTLLFGKALLGHRHRI